MATIKYQQLSTLLLGELQRIGRTLADQRAQLAELRAEQARLEAREAWLGELGSRVGRLEAGDNQAAAAAALASARRP